MRAVIYKKIRKPIVSSCIKSHSHFQLPHSGFEYGGYSPQKILSIQNYIIIELLIIPLNFVIWKVISVYSVQILFFKRTLSVSVWMEQWFLYQIEAIVHNILGTVHFYGILTGTVHKTIIIRCKFNLEQSFPFTIRVSAGKIKCPEG